MRRNAGPAILGHVADDLRRKGRAEEFLQLRHSIGNDASVLDTFDDQLRSMAESDPDRASDIFHALARSDITDDRDVAAIYVKYLLPSRPKLAKDLIRLLLTDPNKDIRRQAHDTLDEAVENKLITAVEAAQLIPQRPQR